MPPPSAEASRPAAESAAAGWASSPAPGSLPASLSRAGAASIAGSEPPASPATSPDASISEPSWYLASDSPGSTVILRRGCSLRGSASTLSAEATSGLASWDDGADPSASARLTRRRPRRRERLRESSETFSSDACAAATGASESAVPDSSAGIPGSGGSGWAAPPPSISTSGVAAGATSVTYRNASRSKPMSTKADCMPGSTRVTRPL